jgi:hypothetical protein
VTKKEITEYFRKFGKEGGKTRARKMTPAQRKESARRAAQARWSHTKKLVREITEGTKELLEVAGKGEKAARTKKAKQKKEK